MSSSLHPDNPTIVRKESIKYSLFGLATALLVFCFLVGPFEAIGFIFIFLPSVGIGVLSMVLIIYLLSKITGLKWSNKLHPFFLGVIITLIAYFGASFIGSASAYFVDGMKEEYGIMDYAYKPFIALTYFGSIPALIFGLILGFRLKKKMTQ